MSMYLWSTKPLRAERGLLTKAVVGIQQSAFIAHDSTPAACNTLGMASYFDCVFLGRVQYSGHYVL